ncbi:MAG: siroheme synthase [Sphingomonadaceae bacterium]|nr:siroheme synthase [Sphingomonadaceae bacterium]
MIEALPLFHRISGQPVIVLGSAAAAAAKRRLVERAGGTVIGDIQEGIDLGARLAFIAHESDEDASRDAVRARAAGLLVNTADRPELCDFTVPSVLDRSPVLLAIGTGGASAGLAKALRLRLEQLIPQSLGQLASALFAARALLRSRWPDAGDRRRVLDAALSEGGGLDPLREESADQLEDWLAGAKNAPADRHVEIVLRSDDPEDLTLREARLLGSADCVAHEAAVTAGILARARSDAARLPIGKGDSPPPLAGLVLILRR